MEESSLTVEFITGPNLVSYDFTVDCYARQEVDGEVVPLTSCSDAEDSTETPVSQSGETGKALSKVDVVVSPLGTSLVLSLVLSLVSTRLVSYFSPFLVVWVGSCRAGRAGRRRLLARSRVIASTVACSGR